MNVGEEFPALLKVDQMKDFTGENRNLYRQNIFMPIGTKLKVQVFHSSEHNRQMLVTNKF